MSGSPRIVEVTRSEYPRPRGFLQSGFWADFKRAFGWRPRFFTVAGAHDASPEPQTTRGEPLLVLSRDLPMGREFAYVPHGPETPTVAEAGSPERLAGAVAEALPPATLFLRLDLPQERGTELDREEQGMAWPLVPAPVAVQPPSTVLVDLTRDEAELLSAMKSKTRYNVRLSHKRGVSVREGDLSGSGDDLDRWYDLYRETARRDRIAVHSRAYYRTLAETVTESEEAEIALLLAEHEGDLLAGILVLHFGDTATYLYGASSDTKRNLMAPYGLQWEAIRRARRAGLRCYDLFGIPPTDDPGHPMHGLYRFKTGFGGRIVHRMGAYDYPSRRLGYAVYRRAEIARDLYYKRIKKKR